MLSNSMPSNDFWFHSVAFYIHFLCYQLLFLLLFYGRFFCFLVNYKSLCRWDMHPVLWFPSSFFSSLIYFCSFYLFFLFRFCCLNDHFLLKQKKQKKSKREREREIKSLVKSITSLFKSENSITSMGPNFSDCSSTRKWSKSIWIQFRRISYYN